MKNHGGASEAAEFWRRELRRHSGRTKPKSPRQCAVYELMSAWYKLEGLLNAAMMRRQVHCDWLASLDDYRVLHFRCGQLSETSLAVSSGPQPQNTQRRREWA